MNSLSRRDAFFKKMLTSKAQHDRHHTAQISAEQNAHSIRASQSPECQHGRGKPRWRYSKRGIVTRVKFLVCSICALVGAVSYVAFSVWQEPQRLVALYLHIGASDQVATPEALTQVVATYVANGDMAKAENTYRQALVLRPQDITLQLQLAHLYALQNKRVKAEAAYQKAVALDPRYVRPHLASEDVSIDLQQFEAALAAYRQAAAFADAAHGPKAQWAELLLYHNQLDEVAQYADERLQTRDGMEAGRFLTGRLVLARHQVPEAVTTLQQVIKEVPNFAPAHYYLGLAYLRQEHVQLAKDAFAKVLELAPDVVEPYLILARLHMQTRTFEQALVVGEKLLTARPNDPRAHRIVGHTLLAQGETAKAIASLKTVTEQAPQDPRGYYELGLGYRQHNQEQEAFVAFEKVLALNPPLLDALSQIVDIALTKGQPDKARERVLSQLRVSPHDPYLYNLLGTIFLAEDEGCGAKRGVLKSKKRSRAKVTL